MSPFSPESSDGAIVGQTSFPTSKEHYVTIHVYDTTMYIRTHTVMYAHTYLDQNLLGSGDSLTYQACGSTAAFDVELPRCTED